jgi:hypothetical protein
LENEDLPAHSEPEPIPDLSQAQLKMIWRQGRIPVVFRRNRPLPVLVRVPYAKDNRDWLRVTRTMPKWNSQYKAWEVPQSWFEAMVRKSLRRYREAYVIQLYREQQKCAPVCWNARSFHCECSCLGANHGMGQPNGNWYEIVATFAVLWGIQRYSCRHLKVKLDKEIPAEDDTEDFYSDADSDADSF